MFVPHLETWRLPALQPEPGKPMSRGRHSSSVRAEGGGKKVEWGEGMNGVGGPVGRLAQGGRVEPGAST